MEPVFGPTRAKVRSVGRAPFLKWTALVVGATAVIFYITSRSGNSAAEVAAAPPKNQEPAPRTLATWRVDSRPESPPPSSAKPPQAPDADAFNHALAILDCLQFLADVRDGSNSLQLTQETNGVSAESSAATVMAWRERYEACRRYGPEDEREANAVVARAASLGNQDADLLLTERRARATLLSLTVNTKYSPEDGSEKPASPPDIAPAERAELQAIQQHLETLAQAGNVKAMNALAQWKGASLPAIADPEGALTWQMTARFFDTPVPEDPQQLQAAIPGAFDEMSPLQIAHLVDLARQNIARIRHGA